MLLMFLISRTLLSIQLRMNLEFLSLDARLSCAALGGKKPRTRNDLKQGIVLLQFFFRRQSEIYIVRNAAIRLQEAFEQEAMDTKL